MASISKIRMKTASGGQEDYDLTVDPRDFLDMFYPVGTYYETSDWTFDPNDEWGGTWELEEDGTVLVSWGQRDAETYAYNYGETFGSRWSTAVAAHTHSISSHTHSFSATTGSNSHTHSVSGTTASSGSHSHLTKQLATADASGAYNFARGWENTGEESQGTNSTGSHTHTFSVTSGSTSHTHSVSGTTGSTSLTTASSGSTSVDMAQPSKVVVRWHRTA